MVLIWYDNTNSTTTGSNDCASYDNIIASTPPAEDYVSIVNLVLTVLAFVLCVVLGIAWSKKRKLLFLKVRPLYFILTLQFCLFLIVLPELAGNGKYTLSLPCGIAFFFRIVGPPLAISLYAVRMLVFYNQSRLAEFKSRNNNLEYLAAICDASHSADDMVNQQAFSTGRTHNLKKPNFFKSLLYSLSFSFKAKLDKTRFSQMSISSNKKKKTNLRKTTLKKNNQNSILATSSTNTANTLDYENRSQSGFSVNSGKSGRSGNSGSTMHSSIFEQGLLAQTSTSVSVMLSVAFLFSLPPVLVAIITISSSPVLSNLSCVQCPLTYSVFLYQLGFSLLAMIPAFFGIFSILRFPDPFKIKLEMVFVFFFGGATYCLYLILRAVDPNLLEYNGLLSWGWFLYFSLFCIWFCSGPFQLYLAIRMDKLEHNNPKVGDIENKNSMLSLPITKQNIRQVLSAKNVKDPNYRLKDEFQKHCQSELNVEALNFLICAYKWSNNPQSFKLNGDAYLIYKVFISEISIMQVNLHAKNKNPLDAIFDTDEALNDTANFLSTLNIENTLYDNAINEIEDLILSDVVPRFYRLKLNAQLATS